jgi:hypothetical protein
MKGHVIFTPTTNQGRALVLSAVTGEVAGTAFNKSILTDWGNLPPRPGSNVRIAPSVDALAYRLFSTAYRCATYECEANGIGSANHWHAGPGRKRLRHLPRLRG